MTGGSDQIMEVKFRTEKDIIIGNVEAKVQTIQQT